MAAPRPWAMPYSLSHSLGSLHLPALSQSRRGHVTGNLWTLAPQSEIRPHLIRCWAKRQLLPQTSAPMCSQGSGQYLLPVIISSNWTIENRQVYQHSLKLASNKQNKWMPVLPYWHGCTCSAYAVPTSHSKGNAAPVPHHILQNPKL